MKVKKSNKKIIDIIKDINKNREEYFIYDKLSLSLYPYKRLSEYYGDKIKEISETLNWYVEENRKYSLYNNFRNEINLGKYLEIKNEKIKDIEKIDLNFTMILKNNCKNKFLMITDVYWELSLLLNNKLFKFDYIFFPTKQYNENEKYDCIYMSFENFPYFSQKLEQLILMDKIVRNIKYIFSNLKKDGKLILEYFLGDDKKSTLNLLGTIEKYFKNVNIERNKEGFNKKLYLIFDGFNGENIEIDYGKEEEISKPLLEIFDKKSFSFLINLTPGGKPSKLLQNTIDYYYNINDLYIKQYIIQSDNINNFEKFLIENYKLYVNEQMEIMKKLKIPLTRDLRRLENEFSMELLSEFFNLGEFYKKRIVKANENLNFNIDLKKFYKFYDLLLIEKEEKLLYEKENNKKFTEARMISDIGTKNISKYCSKFNYLPFNLSNAFIKSWEIWNVFKFNCFRKNDIKSFHFAELPGQFIASLMYYLKINNLGKLDWYAESLNPNSKKVKEKFGLDVFGNNYGILKENPHRWIFGENKFNTGDLTDPRILKFYRELNKKRNLDFISSEAGIDKVSLDVYQKLDLAQIIAVLGSLGDNTTCVVKHFTPYVNEYPDSKYGGEFFISIMNLYVRHFREVYFTKPITSSGKSGEFYIIGIGGTRIDDKTFERYCGYLNDYKLNTPIEPIKNNEFIIQIYNFLEDITNLNLRRVNLQNYIYVYYEEFINNKEKIMKYLDSEYKEWVRKYNFRGVPGKYTIKSLFA